MSGKSGTPQPFSDLKDRWEQKFEREREERQEAILARSNQPMDLTAWRSGLYLRLFSFYTYKRGKDLTPIEYVSPDGKFRLKASPNVEFGLPTVWDADVVDFLITKGRELVSSNDDFPGKIRFTVRECLKELKKNPTSGKNIKAVKLAIERVGNTSYICNFLGDRPEKGKLTLFNYRFIKLNERDEQIEIAFSSDLLSSLRGQQGIISSSAKVTEMLLSEERSGLRKQLIRVVEARLYKKDSLAFWQNTIMELCMYRECPRRFREKVKKFELPFTVEIFKVDGRWKLIFHRKPGF